MELIYREEYLSNIEKYIGKGQIIVLVGQRRIGKSYLLKSIRDIKSKEENSQVIYIDKENREFDWIRTYQDLNTYISQKSISGKHKYILIDKIQDIQEFERAIRSYREEPETDVIVTGSNARMLSNDLSTLIGGRYKEIHIQSLSYLEFLKFHKLQDSDDSLNLYLNIGGLPGLSRFGLDIEDAREYQMDIFNTVLLKDVIMRNKVRNIHFIENLAKFIADSTGKLVSANSISKFMKSQGLNVNPTSIVDYLKYLSEAYIIHDVPRYDIHGKKMFEFNDKFYFEDCGIRNVLAGGTRVTDIEKVIENIIYLHLTRLGYQVCVGQLQASEIDFVCTKPTGERAYIQASYLISDESTRDREFGNLMKIQDNYPKYVISMTPLLSKADYNGITHLHLREFLKKGL